MHNAFEPMKICTCCKEPKPRTDKFFSRHTTAKDGLHSYCKSCRNMKEREYRKRKKNRDEYKPNYKLTLRERLERESHNHKRWCDSVGRAAVP